MNEIMKTLNRLHRRLILKYFHIRMLKSSQLLTVSLKQPHFSANDAHDEVACSGVRKWGRCGELVPLKQTACGVSIRVETSGASKYRLMTSYS